VISGYEKSGFNGIMALRGDPPKGETAFKPHPDGFPYASDLVAFIREKFGRKFALGVAGYPEKHPEAPDAATDLANLKSKVAQGADFVTTQLFFDNAHYFRFVAEARAAGITVPIVPGIMPALSLEQARKFSTFSG
jgi:methylenetetrahydrofolate reductase (NADPH)